MCDPVTQCGCNEARFKIEFLDADGNWVPLLWWNACTREEAEILVTHRTGGPIRPDRRMVPVTPCKCSSRYIILTTGTGFDAGRRSVTFPELYTFAEAESICTLAKRGDGTRMYKMKEVPPPPVKKRWKIVHVYEVEQVEQPSAKHPELPVFGAEWKSSEVTRIG